MGGLVRRENGTHHLPSECIMFKEMEMHDENGNIWNVRFPGCMIQEFTKIENSDDRFVNWGNYNPGDKYTDDRGRKHAVAVSRYSYMVLVFNS